MSTTPDLLTAAELAEFARKSDTPGLFRFAAHLGVLLGTGTLIMTVDTSPILVVVILAHGIVLTFLFSPLHESVHRTAFKSRWLNRLAGWISGGVLILPPRYFSHFHFAHHRHTQDPERDPELLTAKPTSWGKYLWILTGIEYWYRATGGLLRRSMGRVPAAFVPAPQIGQIVLESRVYLTVYMATVFLSIIFQVDWLLWLWVMPALIGQPFLRAYLLAEHWGCPAVKDMWRNTRSTLSNPLVRFFAWNMPYHAEHHAHVSVPFHALPALSRRMAVARQFVSPGYARFHGQEAPELISRGTST